MAEKTVIFIIADERQNAGERDYMKALSAQIRCAGTADVSYRVFKCTAASAFAANAGDVMVRPGDLPATDAEYAAIPPLHPGGIAGLSGPVQVVGVGHSTLDSTLVALGWLRDKGLSATGDYITHMISDVADAAKISAQGLTVYAPLTAAQLPFAPGKAPRLVTLDSVPHTNTRAACMAEQAAFLQTANGQALRRHIEAGEGFAFAVLNAGFPVNGAHASYTPAEAAAHGSALGAHLPPGTHLLLAHGGPRNLQDDAVNGGADNLTVFACAYLAAQAAQGGAPDVLKEPFRKGLGYNVIKAGYMLAQSPACRAFICNAEGYGTMDGAVLHADNGRLLLGMLPFAALLQDPTGQRQANTQKYNRRGISLLSAQAGKLVLRRHPQEEKTPLRQKDAAETIVARLGLARQAPAIPRQKPQGPA